MQMFTFLFNPGASFHIQWWKKYRWKQCHSLLRYETNKKLSI